MALRIMTGPYRIDGQFLVQDPGILSLQGFTRRIADIRIALVAVEPAQEDRFSVDQDFILSQ